MTVTQENRWRAELDIIKELGRMPSTREMQKLLLEKKSMTVHHSTISEDFKKDLESLTKIEYDNQKGGILFMLDNLITIANNIAKDGTDDKIRLDAMKTISKLDKTKTDVLIKFRKAQIEIDKKDRPIYNVFIGKPKVIAMEIYRKKQKELRAMVDKKDENI
jgi:hypothetical protein